MVQKIILRDAANNNWLQFTSPVAVYDINDLSDVIPTLQDIEARVNDEQLFAAGFISYEASPAFDAACKVKHDARFPLLRFGLFSHATTLDTLEDAEKTNDTKWQMDSVPGYYQSKIDKIKWHIHAGETYQVNFTVRQHGEGIADTWALFKNWAPKPLIRLISNVMTGQYAVPPRSYFFSSMG